MSTKRKLTRRERDLNDAWLELFPPMFWKGNLKGERSWQEVFRRTDARLRSSVLSDEEDAELERLWRELRFVSHEPLKLLRGQLSAMGEYYKIDSHQSRRMTEQQLVDTIRSFNKNNDGSAAKARFRNIYRDADAFREELKAAQPLHVKAVQDFASKAWRRELESSEADEIAEKYQQLRQGKLSHEEAVRGLLVRVLVSPKFLFKLEASTVEDESHPVSAEELATRLSYFLWSGAAR